MNKKIMSLCAITAFIFLFSSLTIFASESSALDTSLNSYSPTYTTYYNGKIGNGFTNEVLVRYQLVDMFGKHGVTRVTTIADVSGAPSGYQIDAIIHVTAWANGHIEHDISIPKGWTIINQRLEGVSSSRYPITLTIATIVKD